MTGPAPSQTPQGIAVHEQDPEKLPLLYERFRDVCLVEKEVWKEIYMPRDVADGIRLTRLQDRYLVEIEASEVEALLEANIPFGARALDAVIAAHKADIRFIKSTS